MKTECKPEKLQMQPLASRQVVCDFNGGRLTSDGGGLLLREVESRFGVIRQLTECFEDRRDAGLIEHTVEELLSQRIYGLALGYEELNDHDALRLDVLQGVEVKAVTIKSDDRYHHYRGGRMR